jgi:hypothetical protein
MMTRVDQGLIRTFADKPKRRLSSNVASMVHAIPEMGTSEMSDAENVQNGGMSRRVSEVNDLLQSMEIVPTAAKTSFAQKLAEENGWPVARADAALREYRRFLLMAWVSPDMVVPSKDVDEAWHLHLTHSRHYWEVLCGEILRKPFHHEPSLGGETEDARHGDAYARTLTLYEHLFDEPAPEDVWPRGCSCQGAGRNEAMVLASSPFVPIAGFGAVAAMALSIGGYVWSAVLVAMVSMLIAWLVSAAHASELRDIAQRTEEARRRRVFASEQRPNYGIEPQAMKTTKTPKAHASGKESSSTSSYERTSTRTSTMDRSGDDAGTSFAVLLASDDGSSSSHSHGHSSHSSHSCSSSSSHSCSSSSCGSSSCGGGGGCGGGGD